MSKPMNTNTQTDTKPRHRVLKALGAVAAMSSLVITGMPASLNSEPILSSRSQ